MSMCILILSYIVVSVISVLCVMVYHTYVDIDKKLEEDLPTCGKCPYREKVQ